MLSKIILNNFKSFKNKTEIDFTKTNYRFLTDTNVSDNGIIKGCLFVGANASGKSNIILAIKLLLDLLFKEREINSGLFLCLFSKENDFSIDYYFSVEESKIRYFIKHNPSRGLICETLYLDDKIILERIGTNAKSYINGEKEMIYDENDVSKDTLFLRTLYFNTKFAGNNILKAWFDFLQNSIYIDAFEKNVISYGKEDIGLSNYLKSNGTKDINRFFDKYKFNQNINYSKEDKNHKITIQIEKDEEKMIFFRRKGIDAPIPFNEESLGNRTLLNILPAFLTLVNKEGMLLVDEFSSGFHNELEELLIRYFMRESNSSQILFVSHSTNLLSTSIMRPDQIYSVNFNGSEGSWVKRFSDEQPRMAQNMEKMYLSGVFEGLPGYNED